jgi:hypothetical protein
MPDDSPLKPDTAPTASKPRKALTPAEKTAKIAAERERLLADSMAGRDSNLSQRVAIVLNHYPATRDSDVRLQQQFWRLFEGWNGGPIAPEEMFSRARLTSLARSRARIQNQLGLFLASPTIRKRRGQLEEDEYEEAKDAPLRADALAVFADEAGKTDTHLIVGGAWFGNSSESFTLQKALLQWRQESGFSSELHFTNVSDGTEDYYRQAIDLTMATAPSISFKALRHPRAGLKNVESALDALFYHYLLGGVQHEHDSGRAPLPRSLQFWKDREDVNRDRLRLAELRTRLAQAGKTLFDGKLTMGDFDSVDSASFEVMQIADLYVGAVNRRVNTSSKEKKAKDRLSDYFLALVGEPEEPDADTMADVAVSQQL